MKLDELKQIAEALPYPPGQVDEKHFRERLLELGMDPEQIYQELEMSHRYVQVHQDTSWPGTVMQLHSHSYYEVLCCRSGDVEYLVGTDRFRLQRGDIVFVPPGLSHRPLLPEAMTEPYVRDVLWLSQEYVALLERMFPRWQNPRQVDRVLLRTGGTPWEHLGELLRTGVQLSQNRGSGWEMELMGTVMVFMARLKKAFLEEDAVTMTAEKPELLDRAMSWLEANMGSRITLEDMSRQLYVSKSALSQVFRRRLGVSIHRYLTQRRLIAAKSLILEGAPLEEVGTRVGFGDYSGFYRAFRQEYGISPRQFRKLQADAGAQM